MERFALAPDLGSLCPPTGSPGGWRPTHSPFLSQAALLSETLSQPAGHSQVWEPKAAQSASEARSQAAGCGDAPGLVDAHRCPPPRAGSSQEGWTRPPGDPRVLLAREGEIQRSRPAAPLPWRRLPSSLQHYFQVLSLHGRMPLPPG